MAKRVTERELRATKRRRCVHGHPMKRCERYSPPECYVCGKPVCRKHTIHVMLTRKHIRCCSEECRDAAQVEDALDRMNKCEYDSESMRVEYSRNYLTLSDFPLASKIGEP